MSNISKLFTLLILVIFNTNCFGSTNFQDGKKISNYKTSVTKDELKDIVHKIADSLEYYYVSVEDGITTGEFIKEQFTKGKYNKFKNPEKLAKKLTEDLRSVKGDLHLYVYHREQDSGDESENMTSTNRYDGLAKVQFYDNSIYVKFSNFGSWYNANAARHTISNLVPLFRSKDAIIFDVRDNPGGVPYVVSYLLSYFFEKKPVKLADYSIRYNNTDYSIYTEPNIHVNTYPDVPIYVLVNNKTASAGEELAFWLQGQNRATIIGENTIGAGYGAMEHRLNGRFFISISNETEVDPITKKGFQLTGVIPDVKVDAENALNTALKLIKKQNQLEQPLKTIEDLRKSIDTIEIHTNTEISNIIINYYNLGIIGFNEINQLGYDYMSEPKKAVAILKTNAILFPFYPNAFDSYADALVANQQYELAKENYDKAVQLATLKNNNSLLAFLENRNNFSIKYNQYKKDVLAITEVLNHYIQGTSAGEPHRLDMAFHDDLNLYSIDPKTEQLKVWAGNEYKKVFTPGQKNSRKGRILSIDIDNNIATAKVEILTPKSPSKFIDHMMLLKIGNQWKIVHKSYTKIKI